MGQLKILVKTIENITDFGISKRHLPRIVYSMIVHEYALPQLIKTIESFIKLVGWIELHKKYLVYDEYNI